MITCSYTEFLLAKEKSYRLMPRGFLTRAIEDIPCATASVVYFLLYDMAELPNVFEHTVVVSHKTLAKKIKASPRTASRALTSLRDLGYIEIVQQGSDGWCYKPNKVKVRFPARLIKEVLAEPNRTSIGVVTALPVKTFKNLETETSLKSLNDTAMDLGESLEEAAFKLRAKFQSKYQEERDRGLDARHASDSAWRELSDLDKEFMNRLRIESFNLWEQIFVRTPTSNLSKTLDKNDYHKNINNRNTNLLLTIEKPGGKTPRNSVKNETQNLSLGELQTVVKKLKAMIRDNEIHARVRQEYNLKQLLDEVIFHITNRNRYKIPTFKHALNSVAKMLRLGTWTSPKRLVFLNNTRLERESRAFKEREWNEILNFKFQSCINFR